MDNLAIQAEQAARMGNMRELFNITKKLAGKYSKPERPVKDKDGGQIMGDEQQKNRWKEYFEELLNRPAPQNPPDITQADTDLPIVCNAPTIEEIKRAIKQLRNGKSAGPDNIPAEALKSDPETIAKMLQPLFRKICEEEEIPRDWKEGYLVNIPKKGDLSNCANYRGITLLSVPGKVFNRVILNRMKDLIDAQLRDEQAGFRKDPAQTRLQRSASS